MKQHRLCTAFCGARRIASGELREVAAFAGQDVLIFDDVTAEVIDVGTPEPEEPRKPGRPRLGVVAHEVTLLPRHWEWLYSQPGGASVALRKLGDEARRLNADKDRVRAAQKAAYCFMTAMAGNELGYEEALRALFAGNRGAFEERIAAWPSDVRDHASKLAAGAFPA